MNNILVREMKQILVIALILLIQKNNLSYGQLDYGELFGPDPLAETTDDYSMFDRVTSSPKPVTSTPRRTTTLKSTVKIVPTVMRVQSNETWEQPEVIFSEM